MMKRMLALLTALLMVLACCPASARAGHDKADYLGYWTMEQISLLGMTFDAQSQGLDGFMSFHEDNTVVLSGTGNAFEGSIATFANGGCTISSANGPIEVVIDADGKLRWEAVMDGVNVSMICVRSQPPEIPAEAVPMLGMWEMTGITLDGREYADISGLGRYTVAVYDDGYGIIESPDSRVLFHFGMVDGVLKGVDSEGVYFPLTMKDGQLYVQMANSEHELVLITDRVESAPAAAQTPAPAAPAAGDNPFLGQWTCVNVKFMGMDFTLESLGLGEMSMSIGAEQATLMFDGDAGTSPVRFEGNTCYVEDETGIACTLENGVLSINLSVDGLPLTFQMERVGGPSPAQTPATEEPATTNTWDSDNPLASFSAGASAPAVEEPVVEEPVVEEPVTPSAGDSDSPLAGFASGGSTPVVEEPVTGMPAVEETTTVASLDGTWLVAYVEKNGTIMPAADAGVTGTLTVNGDSGRWTLGDSSSLGILTQDAAGVELTSRAGSFRFALNEQGYLCLPADVNGEAMVLWLSRGDLAAPVVAPVVEEPVVEEPVVEEPVAGTPSLGSSWGGDGTLGSFVSGGSAPAVEEPVVEEPAVEEPAVEEPGVEEPAVEEPVVEEPAVEEPAAGTPSLEIDWGGSFMSSLTAPDAGASDTPAVSVPGATAVAGYEGTWRAVSANAVGLTFTAEELSMTGYEVRFNGDTAEYVVDGEVVHTGNLVVEETGVVITDGIFRIPCHFNEEGNLVLERLESGVLLEIIMVRVLNTP